jgi:D-amino-acid dehydrogenase
MAPAVWLSCDVDHTLAFVTILLSFDKPNFGLENRLMRIVVIGGGILGASTAFHLARAGADVIVVDAAHPGRATSAGAGIICPWVSGLEDGPFFRLYTGGARYCGELAPALAAHGQHDLGFRRCGALCVSADETELQTIRGFALRSARLAPEAGEIRLLGAQQARALFPPLRADLAGIHISGGARVDGRRLNAAIRGAAEKLGARWRPGVATLVTESTRVRGVRVDDERIGAGMVIATAGAWGAALMEPLGITLPVTPQRGQIVHLELPHTDTSPWPVVLPPGAHYLLAFEGGRVVAGATRENDAGFDNRVTAAGQAEVLTAALAVAPGLGGATLLETRVGFRPAAPAPILGLVPGIEGLAVGNGLGASGLTIGPYAGKLLADFVLGRRAELDPGDFSLSARPIPAHTPLR